MNIKDIEELIKFVAKSGVSEVDLESKDFKISIKVPLKGGAVAHAPAVAVAAAAPAPAPVAHAEPAPAAQVEAAAPAKEVSNLVTIKSPMIGTFYRTPSPDKPNFVNVGDEIKPGKVIGIIEAMKLFNEIESEISGKIVKILVDNASPIEYDQPLFLVSPI